MVLLKNIMLPGGGKEANETLEENVIREIKEEFSVAAKKKYLGKLKQMIRLNIIFLVNYIRSPTLGVKN